MKIFIPGNVPSLKNSKEIIQIPVKGSKACPCCKKKKTRPMLTSSKRHKKYKADTLCYWADFAWSFRNDAHGLPKPIRVHFKFMRGSRHKFDWTNASDTIQDLMVEFGWVPDDNADEMLPIAEPYEYDKEKPGVYVWVEK